MNKKDGDRMTTKERFLQEARIGAYVELTADAKEIKGVIVSLDMDAAGIEGEKGKRVIVALDGVSHYEFPAMQADAQDYDEQREDFLRLAEKTAESVFSIGQLQANYDRLNCSEYSRRLRGPDKKHFKNLMEIFYDLLAYNETSEFEHRADKLAEVDRDRQRLEEEIGKRPTPMGTGRLLPLLERLQERIHRESHDLFGSSAPEVEVKLSSECAVDNSNLIVRVPIAFTNKKNVQTADNVILRIDSDQASMVDDDQLSRRYFEGDGETEEEIFEFSVAPEVLAAQVLPLRVKLHYQYKTSLTEDKTADKEFRLLVPLRGESEFREIPNKFADYTSGEVKDDSMFYGRDADIEEIVRRIAASESGAQSRCLALYGQTRAGKSSMLYHLTKRLRSIDEEKHVVINLGSIGDLSGIDEFLERTLGELADEVKKYHPALAQLLQDNGGIPDADGMEGERLHRQFNALFRKIRRLIEEEGYKHRIIVIVDEFTFIYDWIRSGATDERFMKFWKAFIQNNGIFAVIVGQDHMPEFVADRRFTNDFGATDLKKVTYLSEDAAKRLMAEPILTEDENGKPISRYEEDALDRLYDLTAGSAYLIMNLCAGLVDYMNKKHFASVTRAVIADYLEESMEPESPRPIEERLFEPLYVDKISEDSDAATEENKRLLRRIAQLSNQKEWAPIALVAQTENERKRLDALAHRDVVVISESERCKIKVDLYKEWILAKYGLEVSDE